MKNSFFKALAAILAAVAVLSVICAVTVTGSGFLDLSNIAKVVFSVMAVFFGIFAFLLWKHSK